MMWDSLLLNPILPEYTHEFILKQKESSKLSYSPFGLFFDHSALDKTVFRY